MTKQRKGLNLVTTYLTDLNMESVKNTIAQLYDTVIYHRCENEVRLNTSGFKTNHTKNCMNDLLPSGYRVFQKDFKWYVKTPRVTLDFEDNMILEVA